MFRLRCHSVTLFQEDLCLCCRVTRTATLNRYDTLMKADVSTAFEVADRLVHRGCLQSQQPGKRSRSPARLVEPQQGSETEKCLREGSEASKVYFHVDEGQDKADRRVFVSLKRKYSSSGLNLDPSVKHFFY